jgi:hypothetical protein
MPDNQTTDNLALDDKPEARKDFVAVGWNTTIHRTPMFLEAHVELSALAAIGRGQMYDVIRGLIVEKEKEIAKEIEEAVAAGKYTIPDKPGKKKPAPPADEQPVDLDQPVDLVADADQPATPDDSQDGAGAADDQAEGSEE